MSELAQLRRAYDAIGEPTGDELAAARQALLGEIASAGLESLAGNGRPQPESSHGHRAYRRRRLGLIAVAAVILVGVLLVTPAFGIGSRLLDLLQSRPRPPEVQGPVWSPDGRTVLFLRRHTRGKWDITAVNADGSKERVLARNASLGLAWSPDGRQIAFESDRDGDGRPEIYVMDVDGSGTKRLARPGYGPAWSPDGREIAFASRGAVYVVNADGNGQRRLTNDDLGYFDSLAWSPTGRKLAFLASLCFQVYVASTDGGELRLLTWGKGAPPSSWSPSLPCHGALAWSPDGLKFAFTRSRAGTLDRSEVWVMNADGSGKRRLTQAVEVVRAPAWSPDGRRIVFESALPGSRESAEIYVMNADGSGRRNLMRNPAHDFAPAFSPDGRRIVFVSDRDGGFEVYVMNADGSGQRGLTHRSG